MIAPPSYPQADHLRGSVQTYLRKWLECNQPPLRRTSCGLCWVQKWAPLRYASTTALLAAIYTSAYPEDTMASALDDWSVEQLHYVLGDNGSGRSYMIGYSGTTGTLSYARRPHHRSSSCPAASPAHVVCNASQQCDECASPWVLQGGGSQAEPQTRARDMPWYLKLAACLVRMLAACAAPCARCSLRSPL